MWILICRQSTEPSNQPHEDSTQNKEKPIGAPESRHTRNHTGRYGVRIW